MSILDTRKKQIMRYSIAYSIATVFCIVFQFVYEIFSHEVESNYMRLAFLIPLAAGIITRLSFFGKEYRDKYVFRQLIIGATVWLTLGSIFQGALEIYGTTNKLVLVFGVAGAAQVVAAIAAGLVRGKET